MNKTTRESTNGHQENATFKFEIPHFSATASQLVEELNKSNANVGSAVQLIECEPTISSQVLKLANSPLYGATRVISTIGHAIVVLGFRCVAQQAIAAASGALFKSKDVACQEHRTETYQQSLAVATTARALAGNLRWTNPDEAFLAGVVHDVGKLILFQHAGEDYSELLRSNPHKRSIDPEIEAYGISHPELGRQCGVTWSLPHQICSTIANHHLSVDETSEPLTKTLVCSTYLARKWRLGFSDEDFEEDIDVETCLEGAVDSEFAENCGEQFGAICEICL